MRIFSINNTVSKTQFNIQNISCVIKTVPCIGCLFMFFLTNGKSGDLSVFTRFQLSWNLSEQEYRSELSDQ